MIIYISHNPNKKDTNTTFNPQMCCDSRHNTIYHHIKSLVYPQPQLVGGFDYVFDGNFFISHREHWDWEKIFKNPSMTLTTLLMEENKYWNTCHVLSFASPTYWNIFSALNKLSERIKSLRRFVNMKAAERYRKIEKNWCLSWNWFLNEVFRSILEGT